MTALLLALFVCCTAAHSQTVGFEFQSYPDSPIAIVNYNAAIFRIGSDRRQFLTVKVSGKAIAALAIQQTITSEGKIEIITIERISLIVGTRETKRISVSIADVWNRLQASLQSADAMSKPLLSIVDVEFLDGTLWNAPMGRTPE